MNESRVVKSKHHVTKEPYRVVVHVTDCAECDGEGRVDTERLSVHGTRREGRADCEDCKGSGEHVNEECDCRACLALWRQVLAEHPTQPYAESFREWVADREKEWAEHVEQARIELAQEAQAREAKLAPTGGTFKVRGAA